MKTVRQRILEFIRSQRSVSVQELKLAFRMTEQNVRYHLSILKEEGLIEELEPRKQNNRGRPGKIYGPALNTYGENLDLLASALLTLLPLASPEDDDQQFNEHLAEQLVKQMIVSMEDGLDLERHPMHLTQKLHRLTSILNEHHYHSRWEARADAPRVVLGHCPFTAIIANHPRLCDVDAGVIAKFLGRPVKQIAKLTKDAAGLPYCMFRVDEERL